MLNCREITYTYYLELTCSWAASFLLQTFQSLIIDRVKEGGIYYARMFNC